MAAGFHHFAQTRKSLIEYGFVDKANIISHYASVYADGMKGKLGLLNLEAGKLAYPEMSHDLDAFLIKLKDVIYDIEKITQNIKDEYQLWHCCRNKNSKASSSERIKQTGEFAWDKLIFAAKSKMINELAVNSLEIKALGQSIHAFQDIIVHRGVIYNGDFIDDHDELLDVVPGHDNLSKMKFITNNAIRVYRLFSNDNAEELKDSEISLIWMNNDQLQSLKNSFNLIQTENDKYLIT